MTTETLRNAESSLRRSVEYFRRNIHYADPRKWRAGAKAIYRRLSGSGVFVSADELPMCSLLPSKLVHEVLSMYRPGSVLDAGCGTGKTLEFFIRSGLDAVGLEASRIARTHSAVADRIIYADLRTPIDIGRTFDLVWCFEVAEHIHPRYTDIFIQTLTRHAPLVVMSAAPPGQGGEGHFNEQPKAYWVERFATFGYSFEHAATERLMATKDFYSDNMMVFAKAGAAACDGGGM